MTFYLINGSPRKKYNTAQLLEKAKEGILSEIEDAEVETINLYDLSFKGCKSCFHCKRIGGKYYGECPIKDDLRELLPKIWNCDGLIIGSPIYFSDVTGELRSFIERLLFPKLVYGGEPITPKRMPVGCIYTMNAGEEYGKLFQDKIFDGFEMLFENFFRKPYSLKVYDTFQFSDYSKYENYMFDPELKAKRKEEQFPIDLENAFEMGKKIAEDSKE